MSSRATGALRHRLLDLETMPVVSLSGLSAKEIQAYALADNKLALNAGLDQELLAVEFRELTDAGFELELTGFSLVEIDFTIDQIGQGSPTAVDAADDAADRISDVAVEAVSRAGDLWRLGAA